MVRKGPFAKISWCSLRLGFFYSHHGISLEFDHQIVCSVVLPIDWLRAKTCFK